MERYDHIIIGSGLNSLVCAALLAKNGKKVCVLERNSELGGCIRTDTELAPGFIIDLMSISHVQFITSPAYAELKDEIHATGMEYCFTQFPVGVITPEGRSLVLTTDHQDNLQRIAKINPDDAQAYDQMIQKFGQDSGFIFSLLGNEPLSWASVKMLYRQWRSRGVAGLISFFRNLMHTSRFWIDSDFSSVELKALVAPMSLHGGISPETPMSSLMGKLITFSFSQVGDPMVKGGSYELVKALKKVIEKYNGTLLCNQEVTAIEVANNQATGVTTADGQFYPASKGVIGNVTPTQLNQRLIAAEHIPDEIAKQTAEYQYGRGCMMIHLVLDEEPQWLDPEMKKVAFLHVSAGLDSINKAISEAERGLLPEQGTTCIVQPVSVDPSRAPQGKSILWLQLLEVPKQIKGDARGEITVPEDGLWNDEIKEMYADRVVFDLGKHIANLNNNIISRKTLSPADLEQMNINLVGGDPYSGQCGIEQSFLFRPLPSNKNHNTSIKGLFHIGASTHPGPGLGGMSGYLVAKTLLK